GPVPALVPGLVPELVPALAPATDKALLPATSETTAPVVTRSGGETPAPVVTRNGGEINAEPSREGVPSMPSLVLHFLTERAAAREAQPEDVTIATLVAFAIQQILTRLGELLAYATIATALVITAFGTFPFTRGPVLDGFGWLYVFILAGTALIVFIQIAR